jgi:hypothetical protein
MKYRSHAFTRGVSDLRKIRCAGQDFAVAPDSPQPPFRYPRPHGLLRQRKPPRRFRQGDVVSLSEAARSMRARGIKACAGASSPSCTPSACCSLSASHKRRGIERLSSEAKRVSAMLRAGS